MVHERFAGLRCGRSMPSASASPSPCAGLCACQPEADGSTWFHVSRAHLVAASSSGYPVGTGKVASARRVPAGIRRLFEPV